MGPARLILGKIVHGKVFAAFMAKNKLKFGLIKLASLAGRKYKSHTLVSVRFILLLLFTNIGYNTELHKQYMTETDYFG